MTAFEAFDLGLTVILSLWGLTMVSVAGAMLWSGRKKRSTEAEPQGTTPPFPIPPRDGFQHSSRCASVQPENHPSTLCDCGMVKAYIRRHSDTF